MDLGVEHIDLFQDVSLKTFNKAWRYHKIHALLYFIVDLVDISIQLPYNIFTTLNTTFFIRQNVPNNSNIVNVEFC